MAASTISGTKADRKLTTLLRHAPVTPCVRFRARRTAGWMASLGARRVRRLPLRAEAVSKIEAHQKLGIAGRLVCDFRHTSETECFIEAASLEDVCRDENYSASPMANLVSAASASCRPRFRPRQSSCTALAQFCHARPSVSCDSTDPLPVMLDNKGETRPVGPACRVRVERVQRLLESFDLAG